MARQQSQHRDSRDSRSNISNHDQQEETTRATGSSSRTRGEDDATYTLANRRTWSNNTNNLEHFPSFPRHFNTANTNGYQTAPTKPDYREETFLSTRRSIRSTSDQGDDGTPVYACDPSGTYVDLCCLPKCSRLARQHAGLGSCKTIATYCASPDEKAS
jgi:hypothetical protein